MIDLKELRKLAEKATPGPWAVDWEESNPVYEAYIHVRGPENKLVTHAWDEIFAANIDNANYIAAANPQTIIYLLDRINELERG